MFQQWAIRRSAVTALAVVGVVMLLSGACTSYYHHAAKQWAQSPQHCVAERVRQALAAQTAALTAAQRAIDCLSQGDDESAALGERAQLAQLDFQRAILSVRDTLGVRPAEADATATERVAAVADAFDAVASQLAVAFPKGAWASQDVKDAVGQARALAERSHRLAKDFLRDFSP